MPSMNIKTFPLIYRGIVVYNEDPELKGRVKIYVPGIYPIEYKNQHKLLPWAEPAMNLEGGSWANEKAYTKAINCFNPIQDKEEQAIIDESTEKPTNNQESNQNQNQNQDEKNKELVGLNTETGYCSVPHAGKFASDGAQVFLFFEAGDQNKPVYFAAAQSGVGWFSEHPNQHVFHSDNIRVRIDEEPTRKESTCEFNTYNENCVKQTLESAGGQAFMSPSTISEKVFTPEIRKTKLDIEVLSNLEKETAIHLKVKGNVNVHIEGDIYMEHIGNKYETHVGDHYIHHVGDKVLQHEGNYIEVHNGNKLIHQTGNYERNLIGDEIESYQGNYEKLRIGNENRVNQGTETQLTTDAVKVTYNSTFDKTVIGITTLINIAEVNIQLMSSLTENILGPVTKTWASTFTHTVAAAWNVTSSVVTWACQLFTFK